MIVWLLGIGGAGIAAAVAGAVWLGRRLQKGKAAQAASEAQARMAEVADSSKSANASRLSSGDY